MSELGPSPPAPETALPHPAEADNVLYNPTADELRSFSQDLETTTEYGSPSYVSVQRSRRADRTKNAVDDAFDTDDYQSVETVHQYAKEHEMVCVDLQVGRLASHSYTARYYVPKPYARIALAVAKLFERTEAGAHPDFLTIHVPEWHETAIRVFPESGVTAILGSDYSGEAKKSFLRLFMYRTKQRGGLGLHAGSKRVTLRGDDGELRDTGQLFLGLSATGKSTLTAHNLWLDAPEEAKMIQDDVCGLLPDGTVAGSEGKGLYVKTFGLDEDEQPAMYDAVTHESAVLENVAVDADGTVDFDKDEHTTNGRAVVLREQLSSADDAVDLPEVDQIFFITRNPVMPPVTKLSPEEAAAAFMCGESIETSAGDPSRAGEAVRVVGTNPFIIGSKGAEGNRFRDLIRQLDVECFVLNTGSIGDGAKDISVEDSVTLVREIARGSVAWEPDERSGFTVPASVPGMDISDFDVGEYVPDYERRLKELRAERRSYLAGFDGLDNRIKTAFAEN